MAKRQFPTTVKIEFTHEKAEIAVLDQDGQPMANRTWTTKERLSRSVFTGGGNIEKKLGKHYGELLETIEEIDTTTIIQRLWDIETGEVSD
jgi:hypothetical protein